MKIIIDKQEIELQRANSFFKRLKGFMFQTNIKKALLFKTKSIHTFFMREKLDIIVTNKNNNIIKIYKNLDKNKIIFHKDACYIYELPNNSVSNLQIGDKIIIKED